MITIIRTVDCCSAGAAITEVRTFRQRIMRKCNVAGNLQHSVSQPRFPCSSSIPSRGRFYIYVYFGRHFARFSGQKTTLCDEARLLVRSFHPVITESTTSSDIAANCVAAFRNCAPPPARLFRVVVMWRLSVVYRVTIMMDKDR